MKNIQRPARRCQDGVAAVEFALLLVGMILLMALVLLFGRLCWHYTVALKAAHDAALVVASARKTEITAQPADGTEVAIAKVARSIAQTEVAQLYAGVDPAAPGTKVVAFISIACDYSACGGVTVPGEITVVVAIRMFNVFTLGYINAAMGEEPYLITATVKMKYAGY